MTTLQIDNQTITLRVTPLENIFDLRHAVLRPGLPVEAAQFDGDHETTTLHFGAFTESNQNIACCTYVINPWQNDTTPNPAYPNHEDADPQHTYQLRGMCTHPDLLKRGVGAALNNFAIQTLQDQSAQLLWGNARIIAIPFYLKLNWQIASDEFHIPTVGLHHKITYRLHGQYP